MELDGKMIGWMGEVGGWVVVCVGGWGEGRKNGEIDESRWKNECGKMGRWMEEWVNAWTCGWAGQWIKRWQKG